MVTTTITSSNGVFTGTVNADTFIFNGSSFAGPFTGSIDGLGGNDTIQFRPNTSGFLTPYGVLTIYNLNTATLSGIEQYDVQSQASQWLLVNVVASQIAPHTTLNGGAGRDGLIVTDFSPGNHVMPDLNFTNWGPGIGIYEDYVLLYGTGNLTARDNFGSRQALISVTNGATLTGGNGVDVLQLVTSGAGYQLHGNGGDDVLYLSGGDASHPLTVSSSVFDGGIGTDTLAIQGSVMLNDSDFNQNIESIALFPAVANPAAAIPPAHLVINTSDSGAPQTLLIRGQGDITLNLLGGTAFDGRGITFDLAAEVATFINGSNENDTIIGTSGNDTISGGDGTDTLRGGHGDDLIFGGAGNDVLRGGSGNDTLTGGQGADTLYGSTGADIFAFTAAADSTARYSGRDTIMDFSHAQGDKIDVHGVGLFLGGAAFTHQVGEVIQTASGHNFLIQSDLNGDGVADMSILVIGQGAAMVAGDFMF